MGGTVLKLPVAPDEREPISQVLARIRAELDDIAQRIDRNQSTIAGATWAAAGSDAQYLRAMQEADLNAQRIAGLAFYINALAEAARPDWQIDTAEARATLKLAESARSLGDRDGQGGYEIDAAAGEVDFF